MRPPRRRLAPLVLLLLGALAACGPGAEAPEGFRVALLTPGSVSDGGWNQGAYEGLLRIRDALGAEISHVETETPADFEEAFRDYARRGYDLVFGHGFEYQQAAALVARGRPDTVFVTTSGDTVRENLVPLVFELEEATYLCGVMAGRMTRTGVVGMIGGVDLPSIRSTFEAFRAGVEAARPEAEVRQVYLGNFEDTAAAREAALALLEEGADFLIHQANDAGRGVLQAVAERARRGERVFAFGTNRDQSGLAPEAVLASATLDLPGALLRVARRVKEGRLEAEPLRLGLAEDVVHLVRNPRLEGRIPEPVAHELERLEARIRTGELEVPRGAF